jgi:hypothetical protein
MPGFDKRDVAYTEARDALMRELKREGVSYLDEHERGEEVARIVRALERKYPELDEQMTRRLVGEGIRRIPEADDSPPAGEV